MKESMAFSFFLTQGRVAKFLTIFFGASVHTRDKHTLLSGWVSRCRSPTPGKQSHTVTCM